MTPQKAPKTLASRLADARARARRAAHQNAILDRRYVAGMNRKIRKAHEANNG